MIRRRPLLAGLGAATLVPAARAAEPETLTLQIDGAAVPYYAPIYVAVEKGWFAQRGLKLDIIYAAASDIMRNLAAGNVALGFPNADATIAARSAGLPVKVVHTTYQRGIGALLALRATNIQSYSDLRGKRIAVTALGSPNYLQLQVGLKKAGLALADIKLEVIATGAIVPALQAGTVDAIVFSELRRYPLEAAGTTLTVLASNDFLPSFGNVVATGEATLARKPALVRAFLDGLDQGLSFVINGGAEEAIALSIAKYAPSFRGQEADLKRSFAEAFIPGIWQSALTRAKGFGAGDLAAWQTAIDTLAEYKVIPRGFPAGEMVVQPSDIRA